MINSGPVSRGPIRLTDLYLVAKTYAHRPIKVSVGAGPVNLAWHVHFQHYKDAQELCYALAPIFNAEMKDLVEAGATYLQLEDLGAWLPLFTADEKDYEWISDVIGKCCEGVDAKIGWHFCFGNAWGNDILSANFPEGYQTVLPHLWDTPGIDQFVLDYANRDMAGDRVPGEPTGRQGGPGRRPRHPLDDDRVTRAGRRARPQSARARVRRSASPSRPTAA